MQFILIFSAVFFSFSLEKCWKISHSFDFRPIEESESVSIGNGRLWCLNVCNISISRFSRWDISRLRIHTIRIVSFWWCRVLDVRSCVFFCIGVSSTTVDSLPGYGALRNTTFERWDTTNQLCCFIKVMWKWGRTRERKDQRRRPHARFKCDYMRHQTNQGDIHTRHDIHRLTVILLRFPK